MSHFLVYKNLSFILISTEIGNEFVSSWIVWIRIWRCPARLQLSCEISSVSLHSDEITLFFSKILLILRNFNLSAQNPVQRRQHTEVRGH